MALPWQWGMGDCALEGSDTWAAALCVWVCKLTKGEAPLLGEMERRSLPL